MRHADAGNRGEGSGPDELRPLSEKGWRQARGLAHLLGKEKIDKVSSSPYLRCVQTVEPLAEALGLSVQPEERLAEGSSWRDAMAMIAGVELPEVMCSQGDVISGIVDELVRDGIILARDARWQKASTWVLLVKKGEIREASYLPPPA